MNSFVTKHIWVLLFGSAYCIGSLITWWLLPGGFSYDLISYLQISKLIHEGHYQESLNAYWSPLFAWCIVPFLYLKLDWFEAYRMLNVLVGLSIILISNYVFLKFQLRIKFRIAFLFLISAFAFISQLDMPWADFIVTPIFLLLLLAIHRSTENGFKGYAAGLMLALAYFAKGFFLVYGTVLFSFVCLVLWCIRNSERKSIAVFFIRNMLVFVGILGVWMLLLSLKYQKPILTSSPGFNSNIPAPGGVNEDAIQLKRPLNGLHVSEWDDPTFRQLKFRNPFSSWESTKIQLTIWMQNGKILLYMFQYVSYLGILLLFFLFFPIYQTKEVDWYGLLSISVLGYFLMYFLIFFMERYIIPAHFVLQIALAFTAQWWYDFMFEKIKSQYLALALPLVIWLSIVKNPIYQLKEYWNWDHAWTARQWQVAYELGNADWMQGKRTASTGDNIFIVACMLADAQAFGEFENTYPAEKVIQDLKQNQIEIFAWYDKRYTLSDEDRITLEKFVADKPLLFSDNKLGVRIYKISY